MPYQMQARSSTGGLVTWTSETPDFAGAEYPGPGSPEYIVVASRPHGSGSGDAPVANDIAKQGGTDINRVQGFNRVAFKDDSGATVATPSDAAAPPVGGTWVYSANRSTAGFRAKKPSPPGHFDIENYGAIGDWSAGRTGTISSSSATLTVSSATGLYVGQKVACIDISTGDTTGTKTIATIVGTTVTLNSTSSTTVTSGRVVTDNYDAWVACLAAAKAYSGSTNRGTTIIADGHFYFGQTIYANQTVHIEGSSWNAPTVYGDARSSPGTWFVFPPDVDGMWFDTGYSGMAADYSSMRRVTVWCYLTRTPAGEGLPPLADGHTGHGIRVHAPCHFEFVNAENWPENGFHVSAGNSPPAYAAIADGSDFRKCIAGSCSGDGFYFVGNDAHTIGLWNCEANFNWGWGFNDESVVGNTYVQCKGEGNRGYQDDQPYNRDFRAHDNDLCSALYLGCYSEVGFNEINKPSLIIGGTLAVRTTNEKDAVILGGDELSGAPLQCLNRQSPEQVSVQLGEVSAVYNSPFAWGTPQLSGDSTLLVYDASTGWWSLMNVSSSRLVMSFPHSGTSNPRAPAPLFQNGYFIGSALAYTNVGASKEVVRHTKGPSSDPSDGTWEVGDIIWHDDASAGGKIGRVCVTAGTQGTLGGGVTADTTLNDDEITVSDASDLYQWMYITIAGVTGIKQIVNDPQHPASPGLVVLDSVCDATVMGGAVAYSTAAFKEFGDIDP